ncbi:hypothetical protein EBZ80_14885 [bacterium]|nr:hypothetical protein [bacterium]
MSIPDHIVAAFKAFPAGDVESLRAYAWSELARCSRISTTDTELKIERVPVLYLSETRVLISFWRGDRCAAAYEFISDGKVAVMKLRK